MIPERQENKEKTAMPILYQVYLQARIILPNVY